MQKIDMEWIPKQDGYISQIYSMGLEFAFATRRKQATPFVWCKDFLHDCVYAHLYKKSINPYNFRYDPVSNPISLRRTYLLVANSSDNSMIDKMEGCQDFLNQAESKLKLRKTIIYLCKNPPECYKNCGVSLISGSGMWMNAPPLLSLYSLFIRVGFCHKKGDNFMDTIEGIRKEKIKPYQNRDNQYLESAHIGIEKLFGKGYRKFFYKDIKKNYPKETDITTLHNYFGIVGFSKTFQNKTVPYDKLPKYWSRKAVA